jgi:hypothetical protein
LVPQDPTYRLKIIDLASGDTLGMTYHYANPIYSGYVDYSTDGRFLAISFAQDEEFHLHVWDVPPRKPLTWFAAGAVLLILPLAWLARRRVRRLRRAAA